MFDNFTGGKGPHSSSTENDATMFLVHLRRFIEIVRLEIQCRREDTILSISMFNLKQTESSL